jgi:two-component system LytT family response regulator
LGTAGNIEGATELIQLHSPDLVFLDISMPGGSGFELLERLEKVDFEIIFVTGYDEYALDALRVSAVDYLLKPVITEELVKAVEKAQKRIHDRSILHSYKALQHNLTHSEAEEKKVAIPGSNAYDFVRAGDIIRCEGWQKYTRIYFGNGSCLVSSYNIGVFREMLEPYGFFSIHKSHLVNIRQITRYLKNGVVEMSDGSEVPVSRRKREEFVEKVVNGLKK